MSVRICDNTHATNFHCGGIGCWGTQQDRNHKRRMRIDELMRESSYARLRARRLEREAAALLQIEEQFHPMWGNVQRSVLAKIAEADAVLWPALRPWEKKR